LSLIEKKMNKRHIEIEVYTFEELGEKVKLIVKRRMGFYFKEWVKEDTLFLRNGSLFEKNSLNFLGLPRDSFKLMDLNKEVIKWNLIF